MDAARKGPTAADQTICTGGNFCDPVPVSAWIAYYNYPTTTYTNVGFRVVLVGDLKAAAPPPMAAPVDRDAAAAQLASAWAVYRTGTAGDAEKAADGVLALDPRSVSAYCLRSQCRTCQGRYAEAVADGDAAIRLDSLYPLGFEVRSWAYSKRNEWEKAMADADEALRLDPAHRTSPTAPLTRGTAYAVRHDWDHALADLDQFVKSNP